MPAASWLAALDQAEHATWRDMASLLSNEPPVMPARSWLAALDHAESSRVGFKKPKQPKSKRAKERAKVEHALATATAAAAATQLDEPPLLRRERSDTSRARSKATKEQVLAWAKATTSGSVEGALAARHKATKEQVLAWSKASSGNGETSRVAVRSSSVQLARHRPKAPIHSVTGGTSCTKSGRSASERVKPRQASAAAMDEADHAVEDVDEGAGSPPPMLRKNLTARTVARHRAKRLMMMAQSQPPVLQRALRSSNGGLAPPTELAAPVPVKPLPPGASAPLQAPRAHPPSPQPSTSAVLADRALSKFAASPNLSDPTLSAAFTQLSHPAVGQWLEAQRESFLAAAATAPLHSSRH